MSPAPVGNAAEIEASVVVRRMRIIGVCFLAGVIILYSLLTVFSVSRGLQGLMTAILTNLSFVILWCALPVGLFWGTRAVDAHRRFCRACRYERATSPEGEERSGETCPECGAEWNQPRGTIRGRITGNPAMIALAVVLLLAPMAASIFGFHLSRFAHALTPTNLLIRETVTARGFNVAQWDELATRTLTVEQKITLTKGVLDKRLAQGGLIMNDAAWMTSVLHEDWLPEELRLRFYEEMLSVSLDMPRRVCVEETFSVQLEVIDRTSGVSSPVAGVIVGGYFIGEDATPHGRAERSVPSINLAGANPPTVTVAADSPGPLRIRFEYWVFAVQDASAASFAVEWRDDGTPILPDTARWSARRVVEQVVVVEK